MTKTPCAAGWTFTHAACPEHREGVFFRNASTGHLHCTIGGTDCATWADLTEPYTVDSYGYVYAVTLPITEIIDGALETLLWLALDPVTGEPRDARGEDVPDDVRDAVAATVEDFVTLCGTDVTRYLQTLTARDFGHDFVLTCNRHGAGFWGRGLGDLGDRLTDNAHRYGELVFACDDDGTVSLY